MPAWSIAPIIVGAIIILLFVFALLTYGVAFGKRYDKNPLLKYFTASDFNLTANGFSIGKLKGFIYEKEDIPRKPEVVIFAHGMGPGHIAYTTEIAYLCNQGYRVVAVDSLGCNFSGGKNIRGMYEGARTVVKTIDYVKSELKAENIYLVGHSWGGYSVLCASKERKVDKVVAISAPSSPVKTLYEGASKVISKPFSAILCPFWWLINLLKFGYKGNASAKKSILKSSAKFLLVHGDKDKVVTHAKAVYYGVYGENVTKFLAENKAHNPYNTALAEAKLAELSLSLYKAKKMTEEERKEYFNNFDYTIATQEDSEVMAQISSFLN